jgi:hypothetical protein
MAAFPRQKCLQPGNPYSNDVSNSWSPSALPPFLFLTRKTAATAPPAPPIGTSRSGNVVSSWVKPAFGLSALATDDGGAVTWTVKLRVRVRRPPGAITAVISIEPVCVGWKIATDEPAVSVVSLTAGTPVGWTAIVDLASFVLVADPVLVVVVVDEFVGFGVAITSPPLEAFQSTAMPARGEPSRATFTEMTDVSFVKMLAGPPVIVAPPG